MCVSSSDIVNSVKYTGDDDHRVRPARIDFDSTQGRIRRLRLTSCAVEPGYFARMRRLMCVHPYICTRRLLHLCIRNALMLYTLAKCQSRRQTRCTLRYELQYAHYTARPYTLHTARCRPRATHDERHSTHYTLQPARCTDTPHATLCTLHLCTPRNQ